MQAYVEAGNSADFEIANEIARWQTEVIELDSIWEEKLGQFGQIQINETTGKS